MNRTRIAPYVLMSDLSKMLKDGVITKVMSVNFGMDYAEMLALRLGLKDIDKLEEYCQKNNMEFSTELIPHEPNEFALVRIRIYYWMNIKNEMESVAK